MPICPYRLASISEFLHDNPTAGRVTISKATGISPAAVARALRALRSEKPVASTAVLTVPKEGKQVEFSKTSGEASLVSKRVLTLEDLIKHTQVDLKVWEVERFVSNKYEVATKDDKGKVTISPLYQIKAFFKRKAGADVVSVLQEFCDELKADKTTSLAARVFVSSSKLAVDDPHLLEISLPDLHVGKLTHAPEVGENYDLKLAHKVAIEATSNLYSKASAFPIDRILLPVGNDFYNVNNALGETAGGTRQDEDGRWKKSFKAGLAIVVEQIEMLRGKAPKGIDVLIVPGNHDPERVYYLGCVLEGLYSRTSDVRINNTEPTRKYFRYGTTLLGFAHGHSEKHAQLPLILAGERPQDWAETTHREWHLGHLHHRRESRYTAGIETGPVVVRILPSLSTADAWHFQQGYVGSKRGAEAYLYSFKNGYTGHLSFFPKK
jgi:hypothetical protein